MRALRLSGSTHRLGDQTSDNIRIAVGVRTTVLGVALAVQTDLPWNTYRSATVGYAIAELREVSRFVLTGQAGFIAVAIASEMLLDLARGTERLARRDDRVPTLAHGLGREVRVRTGAVPVALDRLGPIWNSH